MGTLDAMTSLAVLLLCLPALAAEPAASGADIWLKSPGAGSERPQPKDPPTYRAPMPSPFLKLDKKTIINTKFSDATETAEEAAPITPDPEMQAPEPPLLSPPEPDLDVAPAEPDPYVPEPEAAPAGPEPAYPVWHSNDAYKYHYGMTRKVSERTIGERDAKAQAETWKLYERAFAQSPESFRVKCAADPASLVCSYYRTWLKSRGSDAGAEAKKVMQ